MRERSDGDRRARIDRDATGGPALAPGKRTRVPDQVPGRGGRALPAELRGKLEGDLGADLSGVQVHTGGESAEAAESLDARAFTVGQSIHFGAGEYNPESPAGQELIAHEVAHTVQQSGAAGADAGAAGAEQAGMEVSTPDDAHEVEAKQFGREFAAGKQVGAQVKKPVAPGTVSRAMIQREEKAPDAGGGGLFSVDSVVGEVEFNEISLKKFKVGPYIDAEAKFSYGMEAEFQRKPGYTGNAPSESKVNASLVQHVKQLLASAWANADWEKQAKIGTDFKSVTLAPTMVWSSKVGPISVEFTPVEISLIDYSPGKKLKVPKVTVLGLELGVPSHPFEVMGFQTKIAPTGTLAVELTPDYLELGKWAMRKMATMITTDVLLAAGVIVGGVATIAGGLYELSSSGEVTKRTRPPPGARSRTSRDSSPAPACQARTRSRRRTGRGLRRADPRARRGSAACSPSTPRGWCARSSTRRPRSCGRWRGARSGPGSRSRRGTRTGPTTAGSIASSWATTPADPTTTTSAACSTRSAPTARERPPVQRESPAGAWKAEMALRLALSTTLLIACGPPRGAAPAPAPPANATASELAAPVARAASPDDPLCCCTFAFADPADFEDVNTWDSLASTCPEGIGSRAPGQCIDWRYCDYAPGAAPRTLADRPELAPPEPMADSQCCCDIWVGDVATGGETFQVIDTITCLKTTDAHCVDAGFCDA